MKKKLLSLALALALCLSLAVPAFAAETWTKDGITVTATPDCKLSFTGTGALTEQHLAAGLELSYAANGGANGLKGKTISISIGPGITSAPDKSVFEEHLCQFGVTSVTIDFGQAVQTVGGFTDVKPGDYFADPVLWAVDKKITSGTSATTFSPGTNCTVAQILTFLWRANGSRAPSAGNPFSDVKESDYYYKAARWAYDKGMVTGSTFDGNRPCTRSMAVTYMWKAAGSPLNDFEIAKGYLGKYTGSSSDVVIPNNVTVIGMMSCYDDNLTSVTIPSSVIKIEDSAFFDNGSLLDVYYEGSEAQWKAIEFERSDELSKATIHYNSKMPAVNTGFTDVSGSADYAEAVKWAVEKGVTSGTSAATFSPDNVCTRGQIVTFLYRAMAK